MLELAILGLLEGQALHGYEIRKRLRDEMGLLSNLSFGSLYPALSRLERQGAVAAVEEPARSRSQVPMTGSLSGERAALRATRLAASRSRRGRKVYRITEEGRRQFAILLGAERASDADDAKSFGLRLAFARHLPPQARLRFLERRRMQLYERLEHAHTVAAGATHLDVYARALMEHVTESTERDISWLDRLIEAERSGDTTVESAAKPPKARAARSKRGSGASRAPESEPDGQPHQAVSGSAIEAGSGGPTRQGTWTGQ